MFKYLRIILLLSLFHSQVLASTDFICTVNKADEDYNLVSTWEAAMDDAGSLTAADIKVFSHSGVVGAMVDGGAVNGASSGATATIAHATATQILLYDISGTFESGEQIYQTLDVNYIVAADGGDSPNLCLYIYDDQGELIESSSIDINIIQGNNNRVYITSPTNEHHNGKKYGNGARINFTGAGGFRVNSAYTNISWLSIYISNGVSRAVDVASVTGCFIRNCIIYGGDQAIFFRGYTNCECYISSCLIYGQTTYSIYAFSTSYSNVSIYIMGCTLEKMLSVNYTRSPSFSDIRNNLVINSLDTCYSIVAGTKTFITNGSADTTGSVGLQNLTTSEFVSVTPGSEDYHLSSSAYSIDKGTDLGVSYSAIDIDGRDRDASEDIWDLGCDEYVAPSTSIKPQVIITNIM